MHAMTVSGRSNASIWATMKGKKSMNRRKWMTLSAAVVAVGNGEAQQTPRKASQNQQPPAPAGLALEQYAPKSMLHVPETHTPRSRFPVIDFHTHITESMSDDPARIRFNMDPANCLAVMDRKNIRTMVSVTGGYG